MLASELSSSKRALGIVTDHKLENDIPLVQVQWGNGQVAKWHDLKDLRSGFQPMHVVQDRPVSNTRRTLGVATVQATRRIAERDLVLVQLRETGESRWLPYEHLIRIRDARIKFGRMEGLAQDNATRFRLKALAYALDSWNQITGALDRLDVDPLPHQIDIVHRIMTSDQSNWLIADDVGLGKTIEVGLLLAAMKRRRQARRVLVICPAGMVRQWQDEMAHKFNEQYFIYGLDFYISQPSHWSQFDKVIVSIDRAKTDRHGPIFGGSGEWDVIVCDEAHHLSKLEGQAVTLRYQLLQRLRQQTDAFIFLTGTPHQGDHVQFINLLRLLRPNIDSRLMDIFIDNSVVAEVVLRNRKSLATDADGEFLFRGQDTRRIEVPLSVTANSFSVSLQKYLQHGYDASRAGGVTGRAIGFVMTTYRKLASSSIAAIERGLRLRLNRLQGQSTSTTAVDLQAQLDELADALTDGTDGQDNLVDLADSLSQATTGVNPFFSDEYRQITSLLMEAAEVKKDDLKLQRFLSEIVAPLHKEGQKLLIFTEYRATQEYLVSAIEKQYPDNVVAQIHGSMSLTEKQSNIGQFNDNASFMVSTEAGGEGINLHERCHVMVNYDLPWNPGRLVQRAGRLYRYGQKERVIVFNLMVNDGFDNRALGMMLQRVYAIARDMAEVSSEYQEGLETDIIGELLERVDVASLLMANQTMEITRTQSEIEAALDRAREAKSQQDRLFSRVEGYDPNTATALYSFGPNDVLVFLEGVLPYKEIRIREQTYVGRVLTLELPSALIGRFSEFPPRASVVRVTADRKLAATHKDIVPMDFKSDFFAFLIESAKSPEFGGEYANLPGPETGTVGLYKLRWQNDQGVPTEEALLPVFLPDRSQQAIANPTFFSSLLAEPVDFRAQPRELDSAERSNILAHFDNVAARELAGRCTLLRHPNDVVLLAAADLTAEG